MLNDKTPRRQLLEEAADTVDNDRNDEYGPPIVNFSNIAKLWNVRFGHLLCDDAQFTSTDVAEAMILVKSARNIASPKRDSFIDIAGYAACAWEVTEH